MPVTHLILLKLNSREAVRHKLPPCELTTSRPTQSAAAQTCPTLKADFLDMERRWLFLARSYQSTERVSDFSAETNRRTKRPIGE